MLKKLFYFLLLISFSGLSAQEFSTHYKTKKIVASKNGILLDSVSLNSSFFKLENDKGKPIDTSYYKVDFKKSLLTFKPNSSMTAMLIVVCPVLELRIEIVNVC